jgi:hypothetical protein
MNFGTLLSAALLVVCCLANEESQQSVGKSLLEEAISGLDSEIKHLAAQVNCDFSGKQMALRLSISQFRYSFHASWMIFLFRVLQMKEHYRSAENMRLVMDFVTGLYPTMELAATLKPSFRTQ